MQLYAYLTIIAAVIVFFLVVALIMALWMLKDVFLPGFGPSLGFTLFYVSLLVLIPLAGVLLRSAAMGWPEFWNAVAAPNRTNDGMGAKVSRGALGQLRLLAAFKVAQDGVQFTHDRSPSLA